VLRSWPRNPPENACSEREKVLTSYLANAVVSIFPPYHHIGYVWELTLKSGIQARLIRQRTCNETVPTRARITRTVVTSRRRHPTALSGFTRASTASHCKGAVKPTGLNPW